MSFSDIIIGLVVLAAVLYFVRHIRGLFKGTASCCDSGGCAGCSSCRPKSSEKQDKNCCHQSADH